MRWRYAERRHRAALCWCEVLQNPPASDAILCRLGTMHVPECREMDHHLKIVAAAGVVLGLTAAFAAAHSWYPPECCRDVDCAPVESISKVQPEDVQRRCCASPRAWAQS